MSEEIQDIQTIMVSVDQDQLNQLIEQNLLQKEEIAKLCNVFTRFEGLFSGKGISSAVTVILKLLKDDSVKEAVEELLPIIQKYTSDAENKQIAE